MYNKWEFGSFFLEKIYNVKKTEKQKVVHRKFFSLNLSLRFTQDAVPDRHRAQHPQRFSRVIIRLRRPHARPLLVRCAGAAERELDER